MHMMTVSERIWRTAQEVIEKLAFYRIGIFDIKKEEVRSKQRVEQLLADSKELGEIVDFLPVNKVMKGKERFRPDFLVTVVVRNGRRKMKFLKVRVFQRGAIDFLEKQKQRKKDFLKQQEQQKKEQRKVYKKEDFIEIEVIVAGAQISDSQTKEQWQEILNRFKES